jgi:chromosome partitioning protein
MEKIVFFNTKGGTGKTTICYNFGWYLASRKNKKVLFMDFDPQVNLAQAFGIQLSENKENMDNLMIDYLKGKNIDFKDYTIKINNNIDLLPSSNNISLAEEFLTDYLLQRSLSEQKVYRAFYRNMLIRKILDTNIGKNDYDYVVIDSQPNFSLLSVTSIIYAQNIIAVIKPELFSIMDIDYLRKIVGNLERKYKVNVRIAGIIINAFEKRSKLPEQMIGDLYKSYGEKLTIFNQKIRYLVDYQKSISLKREPVFISFPNTEASRDIINLFSQVEEAINGFS